MGCVYVCSCPDPFSLGNHFNTFPPCNKKFKAKQISAGLLPRAKTHTHRDTQRDTHTMQCTHRNQTEASAHDRQRAQAFAPLYGDDYES